MESNQVQVIRQDLRNLFRRSAEYGAGGQSGIYFMGRSELSDVVSVDSGTFHKVKTCAG